MGPMKAALGSLVCYTDAELDAKEIRVNAIALGPTHAASEIAHSDHC